MAKIVSRRLRFNPVPGATGYNLYFGLSDKLFDYSDEHVDLKVPDTDPVSGKLQIDVNTYEALAGLPEGVYDLAITAYDQAGNESDFAEVEDVPLDFVAPDAPTGLEVVAV